MIDNKNHQQIIQKIQTITTKINTYLQHFRTSPNKHENMKLVANLCNILSMLFKQNIIHVCYIFKKVVHGRPDLCKNIVTSHICFSYKNLTYLL
jgi:hypothetical protein